MLAAGFAYVRQVCHCEVVGGVGAHVEFFNTEVYAVGSGLYCCRQTFEVARRGHYLKKVHSIALVSQD